MKKTLHPHYINLKSVLDNLLLVFKTSGTLIGSEKRNVIKFYQIDNNNSINVKSFKKPNFINAIIYGYIRKSKAQRSFEYANILLSKNIGTPQPFAYYENKTLFGLKESYYFSNHENVDLMFRHLVFDKNYTDRKNIIKQTALFFLKVHNNGIEFIDNTAGNTLIKKENNAYNFFLVDLNRMKFHNTLSIKQRAKNLAKLTVDKDINKILSYTYAENFNVDKDYFYNLVTFYAEKFLNKYNNRKKLKKIIKFWKK